VWVENLSSVLLLPVFFAFTGLRTHIGLLNGAQGSSPLISVTTWAFSLTTHFHHACDHGSRHYHNDWTAGHSF
jgi:hypothetical protein